VFTLYKNRRFSSCFVKRAICIFSACIGTCDGAKPQEGRKQSEEDRTKASQEWRKGQTVFCRDKQRIEIRLDLVPDGADEKIDTLEDPEDEKIQKIQAALSDRVLARGSHKLNM